MWRHLKPRTRRELWLLGGSLILIGGGLVGLYASTITIPDIRSLKERKVVQSTKIYDRTGTVLLDDLGDNVTRTVVPLSDISPKIQSATIAIEDATFYEHSGIRPLAIVRALFVQPLRGQGVQGGSTITQQVVKNVILTSDRTITRKLKEWVLAIRLEQALTKDQILELYLNEAPYGGSVYGVEEASELYFGKPAKDVTFAEAAYLAALPQAPTFYSPYGNHRDALEVRKNYVLERMHELGRITDSELQAARAEVITFLPPAQSGIRAPHFVFFIREELERIYGREALEQNSWRIITTLDAALQEEAETIVKRYALENAENFNATNAALVALVPQTGDILAMVGSRDYFDTDIDGNVNVSIAERQPGSSFKPFVYAASFLKGYGPDTVAFDTPTQFSTECPIDSTSDAAPCYYPQNYDQKYHGPMSFKDALAQSINIVALKVLYLVGLSDALTLARQMGITTLTDPERYGLTLVLGGGEVKLLELTSAYGVFANEGVRTPYRGILKIEDRAGTAIMETSPTSETVLPAPVALAISDMLSDNNARAPAFGQTSALRIPGHHVAAKTGTTNDYRDAWIVGYTPTLAVGAWAGNNDNSPMEKKVAGFIVAPMWNEVVRAALERYPDSPFPEPQPLVPTDGKAILRGIWQGNDPVRIDMGGNPVSTDYAGPTRIRITRDTHDILHWVDRSDPTGPVPTRPVEDPQYLRWERGAQLWAQSQGIRDGTVLVITP